MTDEQDNPTRRSRRAQRREQAQDAQDAQQEAATTADEAAVDQDSSGEGEADSEAREAQDASGEAEGDDSEAGETQDASGEGEGEGEAQFESSERTERPRKKKKKKRTESPARDRNRRVRDRAEARREARRRAVPARRLDADEMVDDAFARQAQIVTNWLKEHFNIVQWFVLAAIVSGIGYWIYAWHTRSVLTKASDDLAVALADENGRILSQSEPELPEEESFDTRPQFPNDQARLKATAAAYRKAMQVRKNSGASILAKLGLAGTLYDEGQYDAAVSAYRSVQHSPLARHDPDVKGRALEGIGMSLQAKGDLAGADKAYRELASSDEIGFVSLGLFHQAQVAYAQGKKAAALTLLRKVQKKLNDPRSPYEPTGYLAQMTQSLMSTLNPGGSSEFSPAELGQIRRQLRSNPAELQKLLRRLGKVPARAPALPGMPGAPTGLPPSAPAGPAPTGSAP